MVQVYGVCGEYGGIVSIIPYDMVWYVSKHRHKTVLGRLAALRVRLETLWKRLNAFRQAWERIGAFNMLGGLGSIIPYGVVWHLC